MHIHGEASTHARTQTHTVGQICTKQMQAHMHPPTHAQGCPPPPDTKMAPTHLVRSQAEIVLDIEGRQVG